MRLHDVNTARLKVVFEVQTESQKKMFTCTEIACTCLVRTHKDNVEEYSHTHKQSQSHKNKDSFSRKDARKSNFNKD